MTLEIVGAVLLALLVLWLVFEPALFPGRAGARIPEPEAADETRRGIALLSLKEIEFDRATGKLSDADYEALKARYSAEALAALAEGQAGSAGEGRPGGRAEPPSCPSCGPRPEADALFCSACGLPLGVAKFCSSCGTALDPGSRFCTGCGSGVAA